MGHGAMVCCPLSVGGRLASRCVARLLRVALVAKGWRGCSIAGRSSLSGPTVVTAQVDIGLLHYPIREPCERERGVPWAIFLRVLVPLYLQFFRQSVEDRLLRGKFVQRGKGGVVVLLHERRRVTARGKCKQSLRIIGFDLRAVS